MYTIVSYLVLVSITGIWYWHSRGRPNFWGNLTSSSSSTDDSHVPTKPKTQRKPKKPTSEKEHIDGTASASSAANDERESKKRKTNIQPMGSTLTDGRTNGSDRDEDSVDNKSFAEQLSRARVGNKLAPPTKVNQTKRTIKTTQAQRSPVLSAGDSSTAGADADDDRSPSPSPLLKAADPVADMLEKPSPGPSALRITGEAPTKKAARPSKPQEVEETAKQRRARQKREEQKLRNQEAEEMRKKLEDQQRRAARTAEGSSKQQRADAFARTTQANAWKKPPQQETATSSNPNAQWQPLDTYDTPANGGEPNGTSSSVTPATDPSVNGSDEGATKAGGWLDPRLSEEEQMRQLAAQEADDAWNMVSSKKKKGNDASGAEDVRDQGINKPVAAAAKSARPGITALNSYGVLNNETE